MATVKAFRNRADLFGQIHEITLFPPGTTFFSVWHAQAGHRPPDIPVTGTTSIKFFVDPAFADTTTGMIWQDADAVRGNATYQYWRNDLEPMQGSFQVPATGGSGTQGNPVPPPLPSTDFVASVQASWTGDYVLNWLGGDVVITAPINLIASVSKFSWGLRMNGAKITSNFNNAAKYAINILVPLDAAGVTLPNINVRGWSISDVSFRGASPYAGGVYMESHTNSSWIYKWRIANIDTEGHSDYGVKASGSVFEFLVDNPSSSGGLGLFIAVERGKNASDPTGADSDRGLPSAMVMRNVRPRDFQGHAIALASSTSYREPFDLIVEDGYVVTGLGQGNGIHAPAGITKVQNVGFENLNGAGINLGYRGGQIVGCRGANPIAGATDTRGMNALVRASLAGGALVIDGCQAQNEGSGTGMILGRVDGDGGSRVLINPTQSDQNGADVITSGIPPANVLLNQYKVKGT